ncbi:class I SAM-dependent methyltransferase [Clostridium sp. B9]
MFNNIKAIIFNTFMTPFEAFFLKKRRKNLISQAKGNILEVAAGTGVNLDYYNIDNIDSLTLLDLEFNKFIKNKDLNKSIKINYIEGNMESMPFEDNHFDCIVSTLSLCSVDNPKKALSEFKRVLKPKGKFISIEHIIPPNSKKYQNIANRFNSTWHKIGKCNINRETFKTIKECGFKELHSELFGKECFIFILGIYINE